MTAQLDVIAFGLNFLEIVFGHLDHLPAPGEEIYTEEFAISLGGAVTIATEARRAGAAAGVATVLGDDLGSRLVWEHCEREGVDLTPSRYATGSTAGITVVLNFDSDRAFLSHLPARPPHEARDIDRWVEVLERVRPPWCYLHAGSGVVPILQAARALGTRVVLDVSMGVIDRVPGDVIACARLADVFVPNASELRRLTTSVELDGALETAASWGTSVVVKRGAQGALVLEGGRTSAVTEGLRPVEVRDRTGAGDAFAGAMIAALVRGDGLVEAVEAGNAAGSDAVARLGAVGDVELGGLGVAAGVLASVLGAGRDAAGSSDDTESDDPEKETGP